SQQICGCRDPPIEELRERREPLPPTRKRGPANDSLVQPCAACTLGQRDAQRRGVRAAEAAGPTNGRASAATERSAVALGSIVVIAARLTHLIVAVLRVRRVMR